MDVGDVAEGYIHICLRVDRLRPPPPPVFFEGNGALERMFVGTKARGRNRSSTIGRYFRR